MISETRSGDDNGRTGDFGPVLGSEPVLPAINFWWIATRRLSGRVDETSCSSVDVSRTKPWAILKRSWFPPDNGIAARKLDVQTFLSALEDTAAAVSDAPQDVIRLTNSESVSCLLNCCDLYINHSNIHLEIFDSPFETNNAIYPKSVCGNLAVFLVRK